MDNSITENILVICDADPAKDYSRQYSNIPVSHDSWVLTG